MWLKRELSERLAQRHQHVTLVHGATKAAAQRGITQLETIIERKAQRMEQRREWTLKTRKQKAARWNRKVEERLNAQTLLKENESLVKQQMLEEWESKIQAHRDKRQQLLRQRKLTL